MLDEGNAPNLMDAPETPPTGEKSNRTFLIVGGVMAGLVFLTLVCMAVYFLVIAPRTNTQAKATSVARETGNAQLAQRATMTAQAAKWTPTVPATPLPLKTGTSVPKTPTNSPTPVIAANTQASTSTTDPATLVAMQTQLSFQLTSTAEMALTSAAQTAGANITPSMPTTGFFDEVGLPSMIILAVALVAVIFLARRMRKSPSK